MAEVKLDAKLFHRRAKALLSFWKKNKDEPTLFSGADSILVVVGQSDEENPYQKSTSLHSWLFGYEFPGMTMLFTPDKIHFATSAAKAKHLETLVTKDPSGVPLEILKRSKDEEVNRKTFSDSTDAIKAAGKRVGILAKDKFQGKFMTEWEDSYKLVKGDLEETDVSPGIAMAMSVKDEDEKKSIQSASKTSLFLLTKFFEEEMGEIIEAERKVSHIKLAEKVEAKLDDQKFLKSQKLGADFDPEQLEWAYTPIIQSGGVYDLRPSALSDEKNLHGGVVLCSVGVRYKSYCSNVGRTYLFDPNSNQEKYYNFLVSLQKKVFESIKDGAVIKDIYNTAVGQIRAKYPELEGHFVKNIGSGIGIEFRDSTTVMNAKNTRTLKAGMALNVSIGFQNLDNPKVKDPREAKYSLLLVDTVIVTKDSPIVLTESPKDTKHISFFIKDDESVEEKAPPKRSEKRGEAKSTNVFTRDRTRGQGKDVDETDEVRRREHQKELHAQKQEEGLARYKESDGDANGSSGPQIKKFESYKRPSQLPSKVEELRIVVDTRNQSIIVPIYGIPVPFHISTLRNASKNDEGDYVYLRLNFITPGQGIGTKDALPFDDPNANFVRSLTFRSADAHRMTEIFRSITDLKKNVVKRDAEKKEMEDVVEQENLREIRNRRPQRLVDIYARPNADNKRVPGELEIHENGLRYQTAVRSDSRIDLLFNNIRHIFFQPNESELVTIIHVHFKNPIMVGKKKTKDVQFYREVSDAQVDETGNKKRKYRYGDDDEHEQEAEERRRRAGMNKEFKEFAQKIADASNGEIQVDIPFRNLGFQGVPFRSSVLLQPSTDCLVSLSETPFLVVTLADVEIAHLERVQFGLKNFDLVMIFKDFHRAPVHINSIPMEHLDNVKSWLDSCDIAFSEGPLNLNWTTIMKTVNEDPAAFFKDGGWKFLETESDDESEGSDAISEFEMSEEDFEDEESEDEESDFDEDASADEGSEMDDVSGEDWSELEEEAARADKRKANGPADDKPAKRRK